jgi:GMP synthase (glutamine-hydrolysing)
VVADRDDSDPGFVGERLEQLGGELTHCLRETFPADGSPPELPGGTDLVLVLGSHNGVADPGREAPVAAESALVQDCLGRGVPVIAICYGAQLAAHALGGIVAKQGGREIGWYYVDSHDPALCPPGPWVQYHYDNFTVPAGARLLGESPAGSQGFAVESEDGVLQLVAWQFHPEVSPEILQRWVSEGADDLALVGVDPAAFVAEANERAAYSRAAAHALVDVTLDALALVRATV